MSIIRIEALKSLSAKIQCDIPELSGRICVGQSTSGHKQGYPSLAIDPVRFRYSPDQARVVAEPSPDLAVLRVGRFEGTVQMRLTAASLFDRASIEQKILNIFLGDRDGGPGVLMSRAVSCRDTYGDIDCAWELDSDEWQDEKAFDQTYRSFIVINAVIPALATRAGVYRVNQLLVGQSDLASTVTPSSFLTDPAVEVIQINSDGTFDQV